MPNTPPVSQEEWVKVVKNRLHTNGFRITDISFSELEKENKGFLGEHYKAKVTISRDVEGNDETKILRFFLKNSPQEDGSHADFVRAGNAYQKETFFFETLRPLLSKYLKGTPEETSTLFSVISPCYYIRPDLLVLEDLSPQGYFQLEKRTLLNYEQCLAVVEALARFNAASLIFEEKESAAGGRQCRLGDMFPILRRDTFFDQPEDTAYGQAMTAGVTCMSGLIELSAKYGRGTPNHELVQGRLDATMRSLFPHLRPSVSERNVLCHRDMWLNNILFRCDQGRLSCRLVDMQLITYCPPATDLMMLLYLTTTRAFRRQYEAPLLAAYHETLASLLRHHGLDVDHVLPWPAFQQSCRKARRVGVLIASFYCPVSAYSKYAADYDIYDFIVRDRTQQTQEAYLTDAQYRFRIDEVIEEMVEDYIL
ncbi:uncharacterized protein LOC126354529 [Schistocerca gregaria]|uniref:uncharacterized protein LOC126354529 n=1 Tax=Schistocerca gregaria TaxID=7010 RepID=UPI00211E3427|nr:uncharacterized protein LOC126354529 [Schistocerca gregaria]